jgi:anaerobic ribonucleoside-triphosphate reductase activating protein
MQLRVHALMGSSTVNGPGTRAVVWVQGCSLGCPDCWNPKTHDPLQGFRFEVSDLLKWFAKASRESRIEGLTISGGEPMEQAPAVLELLRRLKGAHPAMTTGLFSGYAERELRENLWCAMQGHLDFAVLGRYNARRRSHHPLVASTNQVLRLYTTRYSMADFVEQSVEVHIDDSGLTQITGFPILGSPVHG